MKRAFVVLLGLAVAGAALVLALRSGEAPPPAPKAPNLSRFDAAFEQHMTELAATPGFEEQLMGLPRDELRAAVQGLAAKGMYRLPDERLLLRTQLVGRMLQGLDVGTCSAMVTGKQNEAVHDAAVLVLDPASLDQWVGLVFEAAQAQLEGRSVPEPTPPEIQLALQGLLDRTPEADRERLRVALASLSDQTPAEACWAARAIYAAVPELPPGASRTLARELARP